MIKSKVQNFIITIMIFLFIFNISFTFLPFGTGKIFSILGFFILFMHISLRRRLIFVKNDEVRFFLKYSIVLLLVSMIIAIIHRTFDFEVSYAYFLFIVEHLLGALSIVYFAKKFNKLSIDFILRRINYAITLQSFIVILMLVNEPFKLRIYSILSMGDVLYNMGLRYDGIRGLGVAANTTYELSFVLSLGLIITVYFINYSKNIFDLIKLSLTYMLILAATLTVARTGWIGVIISLFLILHGKVSRYHFMRFSIKKVKFMLATIAITLTAFVFISFIGNNIVILIKEKIIPFVFEMLINLFNEGSFEAGSTDVLREMYFSIPFKTFIIGDGRYISETGSGYYMSTDAGYMRQFLFGGLFSIVLYVFYFKIFNRIKKNLKIIENQTLSFFISFIAMYYFIVHVKGDLFMGGNMSIKTIVIIYLFSSFEKDRFLKDEFK
jgi:hypothetical protein